jgi:predicted ABC-type ATPase
MGAPLLILLAGPNGAGKSTFYEGYFKSLGLPFLNADVLAREIGIDAYAAAKTVAAIRDQMIRRGEGFIAETVFSDPVGEKIRVLEDAAKSGYDVTLIFIGIASPDLSRRRVRARVEAGGHDVPTEKLEARYERSFANLQKAVLRLPRVLIYDNSSFEAPFRFLGEFRSGEMTRGGSVETPEWAKTLFC